MNQELRESTRPTNPFPGPPPYPRIGLSLRARARSIIMANAYGTTRLFAFLGLFVGVNVAPAALLSQYTFSSPDPFGPTTTAPGVLATPITASATGTIGLEISSAPPLVPNTPFLRVDPQGNAESAEM